MFQSDFIDFFSRVPFWVVPIIYVPMIAASMVWAVVVDGLTPVLLPVWFLAGWFVWSLMEYWLHRTLFHWIPAASWGERFHFFLHGVHHKWFKDRYRLVMPPAASLALAVVVVATLKAAGVALSPVIDDAWVFALYAGIVFGYLVYDMVHYYIHHAKPKSKMMLALRSHHNKHHHNKKYKEKKFGVSMTIWDHVFGTYE